MLCAWKEQADKLTSEKISREEYDRWRYCYPKFDTTQHWAKVPSKELSDALVEAFKEQLKPDKGSIINVGVAEKIQLSQLSQHFSKKKLSINTNSATIKVSNSNAGGLSNAH